MRFLCIFACVFCVFISSALSSNNLPAEYTELEYIESTGTQYIDTGVVTSDNVSFEGVLATNTTNVLGVTQNATGLVVWQTGEHFDFRYINTNSVETNIKTIIPFQLNTFYKIGFNVNNTFYIDNNTPVSKTDTIKTHGNIRTGLHDRTKSLKIWDNGTLVRNFIPAKRNLDNVLGLYDTVSKTLFTNAGNGTFVGGAIVPITEIHVATTKYVETKFAPAVSELNTTMGTIKSVVDNTLIQADRIGKLYTGKQNRPDDSEKCPDGKLCLLITEADGTLHWYPIATGSDVSSGNSSSFDVSAFIATLTGDCNDNYYLGNTTAYNELGGSGSAYDRQPSSDSIVHQLNETEWAALWNNIGVVYGTSVCSDENGSNGLDTGTLSTATSQTETNGVNCWCKVTRVEDTEGNGHDISNEFWFFAYYLNPAKNCVNYCAAYCADLFGLYAGPRNAILGTSN